MGDRDCESRLSTLLLLLLLLLCLVRPDLIAGHSSTGNVLKTKVTLAEDGDSEIGRAPSERYYFSLRHRDAPNSPFAQSYRGRTGFSQTALERDEERSRSFMEHITRQWPRQATGMVTEKKNYGDDHAASPSDPEENEQAGTRWLRAPAGTGEYYTELYVGTPRQLQVAMVDFASDVVWIGEPSSRFQKRISIARGSSDDVYYSHFYPSSSSSFTPIPSSSNACVAVKGMHSCGDRAACRLLVGSEDQYRGVLEFAYDDIRVNKTDQHNGTVMENIMISVSKVRVATGGILGLGLGRTSFASQMSRRNGTQFAYCLSDTDEPWGSSLVFGAVGEGSPSLEFTPLVTHPHVGSFHFVTLLAVAVGGVPLRITPTGAVVDMSTRFTRLPVSVFQRVVEAMTSRITLPITTVPGFHLCYSLGNSEILRVPSMSFTFQGGARMNLPMENLFVSASDQGDAVMCLAMVPGAPGSPIVIGSTQQQNFLMVVDRARSRLGFARRQCASLLNL